MDERGATIDGSTNLPGVPGWRLMLPVVAVVAITVLVGTTVGLLAFRAHRPVPITHDLQASRTMTGWRISARYGMPREPAVAGGHVAWWVGPSLFLLDAVTGRVMLLQGASDAEAYSAPVATTDHIVWIAVPRTQDSAVQVDGRLSLYDVREATRREAPVPGGDYSWLTAFDGAAVWEWTGLDGGREIRGVDLTTGRQFTVATVTEVTSGLAGEGRTVVWGEGGDASFPLRLVVADLDDSGQRRIGLPQTAGQHAMLDGLALEHGTVVWGLYDSESHDTLICAYDLANGDRRVITRVEGWAWWRSDGERILLADVKAGGTTWRLLEIPLTGGGAYELAEFSGQIPTDFSAGGGGAAWIAADDRDHRWLETMRVPR